MEAHQDLQEVRHQVAILVGGQARVYHVPRMVRSHRASPRDCPVTEVFQGGICTGLLFIIITDIGVIVVIRRQC